MVEVFSAGNDGDGNGNPADPKGDEGYGSINSPGTAKNVITVGAAESVRGSGTDGCGVTNAGADSASDIINFSSRGPTQDGRMKPDVVAPGTHITGASPQHAGYTGAGVCDPAFGGSAFYSLVSGTSQAAPHVSGAAALLRDWYVRSVDPQPPSPAMTKAMLVNTATDIDGGDSGKDSQIPTVPNTDEGWGRVDVGAALDATQREYVDQDTVLDATGQSALHSYSVADTGKPVRVTLAWTDPPPATVTGNAFVNDLDLEVNAGGRTYRGNWMANGLSIPGGQADFRNNVENVVLPAGTRRPDVREGRGEDARRRRRARQRQAARPGLRARRLERAGAGLLAGARAGRRDGRRRQRRPERRRRARAGRVLHAAPGRAGTRAPTWRRA